MYKLKGTTLVLGSLRDPLLRVVNLIEFTQSNPREIFGIAANRDKTLLNRFPILSII